MKYIAPLQGLKGIVGSYRIGRCPMLKVSCAYSAIPHEPALKSHLSIMSVLPFKLQTPVTLHALEGQSYIKEGHPPVNMPCAYDGLSLRDALEGQSYIKEGHRPVNMPRAYDRLSLRDALIGKSNIKEGQRPADKPGHLLLSPVRA